MGHNFDFVLTINYNTNSHPHDHCINYEQDKYSYIDLEDFAARYFLEIYISSQQGEKFGQRAEFTFLEECRLICQIQKVNIAQT